MTEAEKNEIVGLVMTEISSQAVDFDIETEQPQANDLLTAVRKTLSGEYKGVTLKWDDVARIATELANQAATRAEQALSDTTATKTEVGNMKASVEQTVTDFNALAEEKKQEVQGVYQNDLDELKGDLVELDSRLSESITEISKYDKDYYMFLSPMYLQAHLLDYAKTLGLEYGKYISYINGSEGVNEEWVATKYIPILSTNIRYRIVAVRDIMFALYDENLNFVIGKRVVNTWYLNQDNIPTNAKYLRFSTYKSDYDNCEFVQWQDPMASKFDIGENVKIPYSRITDAPQYDIVKETVVKVSDYTNLRACLESIQPNEKNHYIVEIPNGTYDVKSMYTESERNASGFRGLFVPDFTVLKGTGNKEDTIIRYDNSESEAISQNISTLHFRNWVEMENITVIGTRVRYAVHDDFSSTDTYNHRLIKNCEFKVYESYYNDAYGSGQIGGADWTFENCTFDVASVNADFGTSDYLRSFSNHASTNQVRSSKFKFINCDFKSINTSIVGVRLTSMSNGSTAFNYATMIGCRVNGKIRLEAENTSYGKANKFKLNGFANSFGNSDVIVYFTDGVDYSSYVDLH